MRQWLQKMLLASELSLLITFVAPAITTPAGLVVVPVEKTAIAYDGFQVHSISGNVLKDSKAVQQPLPSFRQNAGLVAAKNPVGFITSGSMGE